MALQFAEDEKVSIIAHVAPKELQQSIFTHSDALNTYAKIRDYIEQYLINKNLWKRPQGSTFGLTKAANKVADDQGPAPMDIGAIDNRGKGKGNKGKERKRKKLLAEQFMAKARYKRQRSKRQVRRKE